MTALDRLNAWLYAHQDKVAHFALSSVLAVSSLTLAHLWLPQLAMMVSVAMVASVGASKEVWDHYHPPHQCDVWDFIADLAGGLPVWLAFWVGGS